MIFSASFSIPLRSNFTGWESYTLVRKVRSSENTVYLSDKNVYVIAHSITHISNICLLCQISIFFIHFGSRAAIDSQFESIRGWAARNSVSMKECWHCNCLSAKTAHEDNIYREFSALTMKRFPDNRMSVWVDVFISVSKTKWAP